MAHKKTVLQSGGHQFANHENNGIIIQFILFEMFLAVGLINKIEDTFKKLRSNSATQQELIGSLAEAITALAGSSQKSMRIFTSNLNEGILAQTKNYCSYFASNLEPKDPDITGMQRNANRAWKHSLDCLDTIRKLLKNPSCDSQEFSDFNISFERMVHRFFKLVKVVGNVLHKFNDDENVILFLITHTKQLDKLFEKEFVIHTLIKMFPNGIIDAERFLTQKYMSRGFTHLIPSIIQKIAKFEPALV
jgi:hypothetical protein